jgi:hypothetical protein
MVEQHRVRSAAQHMEWVLPGLTDERLALVEERLTGDDDPAAQARLAVVRDELRRRGHRAAPGSS